MRRFLFGVLTFCCLCGGAALILAIHPAAVQAEDDIAAQPSCPYCGMDRQKFAHSRMFVTFEDGSSTGTCSLHCMAIEMAVNIDKAIADIAVGDYNTKELIDAKTAIWVIGGNKMGVMTTRAKWAFATHDAAEKFIAANGGSTAGFDEVMQAAYEDMYKDVKMIRDKKKMKRQMKKS